MHLNGQGSLQGLGGELLGGDELHRRKINGNWGGGAEEGFEQRARGPVCTEGSLWSEMMASEGCPTWKEWPGELPQY